MNYKAIGGAVGGLALLTLVGLAGHESGVVTERSVMVATATAEARATQTVSAHATATAEARATATARAQATQTAVAQQESADATATAQAENPAGVHVCAGPNYDDTNVRCSSDNFVVSDTSAPRVVVSGPDGNDFTAGTVTFIIARQNGDGSLTTLGSYDDTTVDMNVNRESLRLLGLFVAAEVVPEDGQAYQISAQEPTVSLGSTTFTYTA
jgi:hypothetical protein